MRAKRSLGQNFLVDRSYIDRIIRAVAPESKDEIVEIGPGRGAITETLVPTGAKVTAIELDRELVPLLRAQFAGHDNFRVIERDVLTVDFAELLGSTPAKLVANLPYYISTAVLQHLTPQRLLFSTLVLMFQKEVVDRITAPAGDSERGFLTVLTQSAFVVEKLFDVPPAAFRPAPKVTSSVVRLTPKQAGSVDDPAFRSLAAAAFAQKRKTILNNLKNNFPDAAGGLTAAGIDPQRRAETLDLEEWELLFNVIRG